MDFKIAVILTLLAIPVCHAELKDPTKPAFYSSASTSDYQPTDVLKLSSIWTSAQTQRATINGVTAKPGEVILADVKIIKINNNSVLIEQNGVNRTLSLLTRSYKKPIKLK